MVASYRLALVCPCTVCGFKVQRWDEEAAFDLAHAHVKDRQA